MIQVHYLAKFGKGRYLSDHYTDKFQLDPKYYAKKFNSREELFKFIESVYEKTDDKFYHNFTIEEIFTIEK